VARVVLFTFGSDTERNLRRAFAAAGHDFRPIEPSYPQCKGPVEAANPDVFLLEFSQRPSHVREAIAYFADLQKHKSAPVLVVGPDESVLKRLGGRVPRAQWVPEDEALARVEQALAGARRTP
jgi:hypothetical protein